MEPFEIMVSESQERMLCVVEPDTARRGARRLRALGGARHGDRRRSPTAAAARASTAARSSATCRWRRSSTTARSTTSSPRSRRRAGLPRAARARSASDADAEETLLALLGSPNVASQALGVRAVRLDRRLAHRAPPGRGRRRGARSSRPDGGTGAIAVVDRRQRPARGLRPVHRRGRGGARVRAQPRLRRAPSRSASPTASTSATPRSRTSRGSSRARSTGLRDACLALGVPVVGGNVSLYNEGGEGPIYPTPVVGMVGQLARSRAACRARASPSEGDAIALVGPFAPRSRARSSRSCAGGSPTGCPRWTSSGRRAALDALREAVRAGGLADRPRRLRGRAGLRAGRVLHRAAGSARGWTCRVPRRGPTRSCSARGRAAWSSPVRRAGRARFRAPQLGAIGGDRLQIAGCWTRRGSLTSASRGRSRLPTRD